MADIVRTDNPAAVPADTDQRCWIATCATHEIEAIFNALIAQAEVVREAGRERGHVSITDAYTSSAAVHALALRGKALNGNVMSLLGESMISVKALTAQINGGATNIVFPFEPREGETNHG